MLREIRLVPYNAAWKQQFDQIRATLLSIFGDLALDIHHFGSTAIPGMPAKPIIDVMVVVRDIGQVDGLNDAMAQRGYIARGENGIPGRRYYQRMEQDGVNHLEHIHCYEPGNPHVQDELLFRDFLRQDQAAFDAYKAVKMDAAAKYRISPEDYARHKSDCVQAILDIARQAAISHS